MPTSAKAGEEKGAGGNFSVLASGAGFEPRNTTILVLSPEPATLSAHWYQLEW